MKLQKMCFDNWFLRTIEILPTFQKVLKSPFLNLGQLENRMCQRMIKINKHVLVFNIAKVESVLVKLHGKFDTENSADECDLNSIRNKYPKGQRSLT